MDSKQSVSWIKNSDIYFILIRYDSYGSIITFDTPKLVDNMVDYPLKVTYDKQYRIINDIPTKTIIGEGYVIPLDLAKNFCRKFTPYVNKELLLKYDLYNDDLPLDVIGNNLERMVADKYELNTYCDDWDLQEKGIDLIHPKHGRIQTKLDRVCCNTENIYIGIRNAKGDLERGY